MIKSILDVCQLSSRQTYYNWKKEGRPILNLLEKYFNEQDLEEFLETGKITKMDMLHYVLNKQNDNLLTFYFSNIVSQHKKVFILYLNSIKEGFCQNALPDYGVFHQLYGRAPDPQLYNSLLINVSKYLETNSPDYLFYQAKNDFKDLKSYIHSTSPNISILFDILTLWVDKENIIDNDYVSDFIHTLTEDLPLSPAIKLVLFANNFKKDVLIDIYEKIENA